MIDLQWIVIIGEQKTSLIFMKNNLEGESWDRFDEFYISEDYLSDKEKKTELVFENGELIRNDIIPIEDYKIGDTLRLDVYYYQNWLAGYKSVSVQGIIEENNGKKVKLKIFSLGTDKESIKRKLQKEINLNYVWPIQDIVKELIKT